MENLNMTPLLPESYINIWAYHRGEASDIEKWCNSATVTQRHTKKHTRMHFCAVCLSIPVFNIMFSMFQTSTSKLLNMFHPVVIWSYGAVIVQHRGMLSAWRETVSVWLWSVCSASVSEWVSDLNWQKLLSPRTRYKLFRATLKEHVGWVYKI